MRQARQIMTMARRAQRRARRNNDRAARAERHAEPTAAQVRGARFNEANYWRAHARRERTIRTEWGWAGLY